MPKGQPATEQYRDAEIVALKSEIEELQKWVNDLHAGMYINCVYCGHRYGPDTEVPASMADVLKKHIEQCPKHPMSALKAENEKLGTRLRKIEEAAREAIKRAQHGVQFLSPQNKCLMESVEKLLTDALGEKGNKDAHDS